MTANTDTPFCPPRNKIFRISVYLVYNDLQSLERSYYFCRFTGRLQQYTIVSSIFDWVVWSYAALPCAMVQPSCAVSINCCVDLPVNNHDLFHLRFAQGLIRNRHQIVIYPPRQSESK